jgi:hypothetical protein
LPRLKIFGKLSNLIDTGFDLLDDLSLIMEVWSLEKTAALAD